MQPINSGASGQRIMRTRTFRWLVAGTVLLACGWWVYNGTGPRFKGRSAAYWFRAYDSHEQNSRIALAFRTMGSNAVPLLIAELEAPPSRIGEAFNSFQNLFRQWKTPYNERVLNRKAAAAYLLGEMGEAARPATPTLETASTNSMSFVATAARVALIKIRKESLTPYIELLRDRSDHKWYSSATLLGAFGTNASAAVPLLLESLQRSDNQIQAGALMALGMIRSEPQACVAATIPFLTNADVALRRGAFFALLSFKGHARSASNEIAAGLSDTDPSIRIQALWAVNAVLTPTEQQRVLPVTKALLNDTNPFVRDSAKKVLREIRASASK